MSEPMSAGAAGLAAYKMKLLLLGSSAMGAAVMALSRPPKSRRELFSHAIVALGCSFLFGNPLAHIIDYYSPWIDMTTAPQGELTEFLIAVHGMVGAVGWGVMGALGTVRDKLRDDPQPIVEWVIGLWKK